MHFYLHQIKGSRYCDKPGLPQPHRRNHRSWRRHVGNFQLFQFTEMLSMANGDIRGSQRAVPCHSGDTNIPRNSVLMGKGALINQGKGIGVETEPEQPWWYHSDVIRVTLTEGLNTTNLQRRDAFDESVKRKHIADGKRTLNISFYALWENVV